MNKMTETNRRRSLKASALAGSALSLLLASGPIAIADGADIVNGWITQSQSSDIFSVSVGDVAYDGLNSNTTVQDLQVNISLGAFVETIGKAFGEMPKGADLDDASYDIVFPDIKLTNLRDIGDRYSVDAVRADAMNFDMDMGSAAGDIPPTEIVYENLSIDALSWAKLPELANDPNKPLSQFLPVLRAMIDFSFDEMTIDSAMSVSPLGEAGPAMSAEYGLMRMGKTVRGDVSTMELDGFTMTVPIVPEDGGDALATATISAESISARDYNYGTMLDTLFAPASGTPGDYKTAIGSIALNGLNISVPSAEVEATIDSFVFEDMGVRTPAHDFLSELESLALKERAGEEVDMPEEDIVKLIASIYGAFSIGKFEVAGIVATGPEITTAKVGSYGMSDLSADGLGAFYVEGIDVVLTNGDVFKYGKSTIEDVSFPDLAALVAVEKNIEAQNIEEVLKAIPIIGKIENSGLDFQISEEDLKFSLGKSVLEMGGHIGPVPTSINIEIDNLKAPVDKMESEPRQVFEQLGYEFIDVSYDLQIDWDESTQDLKVSMDTALVDGGRLVGKAKLGSIPRLVFEKPDQTAVFSLFATTLKNLELEFEDQSIVERGLVFAALMINTDPETMKAQLFAMTPIVLGQFGAAELAADVNAALRGVLENGSKLIATAVPAAPLPLVSLGSLAQSNPAALIESLNVSVGNK